MKVHELIKILEDCDPNDEVILGLDGDANGHAPLDDAYVGLYVPESKTFGHVYDSEEDEISVLEDAVRAIFLYPMQYVEEP